MSETLHSHLFPGVPLALDAAIVFGTSAPLSKLLLGTVNPLLLAGLLYLGAGLGLAIIHLCRSAIGIPAKEAPLRRGAIVKPVAVCFANGGIDRPPTRSCVPRHNYCPTIQI